MNFKKPFFIVTIITFLLYLFALWITPSEAKMLGYEKNDLYIQNMIEVIIFYVAAIFGISMMGIFGDKKEKLVKK